jgi:hypothetical protein
MISRLKKNILTQLPPKKRHVVSVEVTDEALARKLWSVTVLTLAIRLTGVQCPSGTNSSPWS